MNQRTESVGFRVVTREQFDVAVHVSQGVLPIRRCQLGVRNRTVAVAHVVGLVQLDGPGGILDSLQRLRGWGNRVGVCAEAPESGISRVQFDCVAVVGERLIMPAGVHVGDSPGLVQACDVGLDTDRFIVGSDRGETRCRRACGCNPVGKR